MRKLIVDQVGQLAGKLLHKLLFFIVENCVHFRAMIISEVSIYGIICSRSNSYSHN